MINTDLLPGAPICLNLVMNYVAFTATNTAIWIIIAARTFLFMLTVAADGELASTGTSALASMISIQSLSIVSAPNSATLMRRREGTTTVVAVLLPVGRYDGGGVEGGPHLTWPSECLRGGWSSCRWSQPGRSMLHPLVCLQPLFRGCLVVTHVARRCNRDSCHLSNVLHCRRVLLLFQEVLSPLGISSQS